MEDATKNRLRVCYFGTYRASYGRNQIVLQGLQEAGAEVVECHAKLWDGIDDRVQQASGGWRNLGFLTRVLKVYWRLFRTHNQTPDYDVMLIGYPGPFDAYLGRLLSWWRRKPMALNHYMSLYLVAKERGLVEKSPFTGWLIRTLEGIGLKLNDLLIADTDEYVAYHCRTYGLTADRFRLVPNGADNRFFYPRPQFKPPADRFQILYYGTYLDTHGMPAIVKAAALLRDEQDIVFDFYGDGPERPFVEQLIAELDLTNIRIHDWLPKPDLPRVMAEAHICLGIFGTTQQAEYTIQNKIWEAAAMGRPIISCEATAVMAALRHEQELYYVPPHAPEALAAAILHLKNNPELREKLGVGANGRFNQGNTIYQLGKKTIHALESIL